MISRDTGSNGLKGAAGHGLRSRGQRAKCWTYCIDGTIVENRLAIIHQWFQVIEERRSISSADSCRPPRGVLGDFSATYQSSEVILTVLWLEKVFDGEFELKEFIRDSRRADSSRG